MSAVRFPVWLLWMSAIAFLYPARFAIAQEEIKTTLVLESSDWQDVLDNLFGAPDDGLLDGTDNFEFRADHVLLTAEESSEFFASEESATRLSELVQSTLNLHGRIHLQGSIEDQPFELSLADDTLDLEGVAITGEKLDMLASGLASIINLREMRIGALVDGRVTVVSFRGDDDLRVLEKTTPVEASPSPPRLSEDVREIDSVRPSRIGIDRPVVRPADLRPAQVRPEPIERVERIEKPQRVEKPERIEKPPKFEKPERPDVRKK